MIYLLYYLIFIFILGVTFLIVEGIQSLFSITSKNYTIKVPYTKLINETMYYTGSILYENKIKHYPVIDIRYYATKKWAGRYYNQGTIIIYLKSNDNLIELVDTVLHEISHHISMKTQCEEYIQYDKLMVKYGYDNHPEEIKARKFASDHLKPCIEYLLSKGVIE